MRTTQKKYSTLSEQETRALGASLAPSLSGGDIVTLAGELGSGKTTFIKGIAAGLEVKEGIVSPTFTLMNVHHCSTSGLQHINTLVHIDTYRLKTEQELVEIGVEDYLGAPGTVCVIEWPEKMKELLAGRKTIRVTLSHSNSTVRKIGVEKNFKRTFSP